MKWNIQSDCNSITDIWNAIAKSKNFTIDELDDFILNSNKLQNPNILPNINAAVERIKYYIDSGKKILISGDYDTDGVTSTTCMILGLTYLKADVIWKIPLREEGYGLSKKIVDQAKENNVELIITVDNGIAAHEAIKYANELGIEVVVTDHHQWLTDILPTEITVNPCIDKNYVFPNICGCMVVYKVLRMLIPELTSLPIHNDIVALTTLGTIGDVMPLINENRTFVKRGLSIIRNTDNYGLKTLLKQAKVSDKPFTSTDLAFSIIPIINAVGRFDDASLAVELFLADDSATAKKLVDKLISLNNKRKELQNEVVQNIEIDESKNFIIQVLDVPAGLMGVIAGRIANIYQKPCIALKKFGDSLGGSGRCPNGFNISSVIDNEHSFGGGHEGACGVSLKEKDFEWFIEHCNKLYNEWNTGDIPEPELQIIANLSHMKITEGIIDKINTLMPFGEANKEPVFCINNIHVDDYKIMGKLNNTVKLFLSNGLNAIAFNEVKDKYDSLKYPSNINIAFTLGYNYWLGERTIQLMVVDIEPAENIEDIFDF